MNGIYEAVASTTEGTYRAFVISGEKVCILEDGLSGLADTFGLSDYGGNARIPESLLNVLTVWIHENRRGIDILEVRLTLGNA